jgi:uncharacterized membrane protein
MVTPFVILLVGQAAQVTAYSSAEIPKLPDTDTFGSAIVTEGGAVAGYWYRHVAPGHAGAILAKPFVWIQGKMIALPLGSCDYGHVLAGNDKTVVGDVRSEKGWLPAMWQAHESKGWEAPKLTLLDQRPGTARAVSKNGVIWIDTEEGLRSWTDGTLKEYGIGRFTLAGLDDKGRFYGTRNSGPGGFPMTVAGEKAARGDSKMWHVLHPEGYSFSRIHAVNGEGHAVGTAFDDRYYAVIWDGYGFRPLSGRGSYSSANGINNLDQVVGTFTDGKAAACMWEKGQRIDLSTSVAGVILTDAAAINGKGQIVAEGDGRLFLLSRKA